MAATMPLPMTRGRRAALAVGVPACLLLVAATGASLVADIGQGSYPVRYTAPAGVGALAVHVPSGQLTVRQATGSATVAGTARYSIERSTFSASNGNGKTTIGYRCPVPLGTCALDATVSVPSSTSLTASIQGGNVALSGTASPVTISTAGGSVTVNQASGPLTLSTGGGDIKAAAITARTLSATTLGGSITGAAIAAPVVTAATGGGDITIEFTRVPIDVQVRTSGGNITLDLPPGTTAYHVTATTGGGHVTDSLPRNSASSHTITATSGGGNITLAQQ
jgi:DUF4097 and DUF4098 domain-containing protein YvlB